jgi:hypothetical protein
MGTLIRHYPQASRSLAVLRLSPGMVNPPVEAGLIGTVASAVILEACAPTTRPAAVTVAPVAGLADPKRPSAPAAQEQVQHNLRRQALRHRPVLAKGGQAASAVPCFPSLQPPFLTCPGRAATRRGFFFLEA